MKIEIDIPEDIMNIVRPNHMRPLDINIWAKDITPDRFREICKEYGFEHRYGAIVMFRVPPNKPVLNADWIDNIAKYHLFGPVDA